MVDIKKIADSAIMIINGYSFNTCDLGYKVLNLNNINCSCIISKDGEILETNMCDIENQIVLDYFRSNKEYLGDIDA